MMAWKRTMWCCFSSININKENFRIFYGTILTPTHQTNFRTNLFLQKILERTLFLRTRREEIFLLEATAGTVSPVSFDSFKILDYWETLQILHEEKLKNQQLEETGLPNLGKTISQVWKPISLFFPIFLIWIFSFGFTEVSIHKRSN